MEAEIEKIREEAEKETKAEKGDGKERSWRTKKEELQKKGRRAEGISEGRSSSERRR